MSVWLWTLFSLGQAHPVLFSVEDSVELPHEDLTQNPLIIVPGAKTSSTAGAVLEGEEREYDFQVETFLNMVDFLTLQQLLNYRNSIGTSVVILTGMIL